MAILKHIPMKNGNYTKTITYLLFQHDERTGKQITDEYDVPIMREEYYFEGINCDPYAFDFECDELNKSYNKNQSRDDVKLHHYIISFDPRDSAERGLTGEKAQELGMEFARRNFAGHQIIVCTHTDGHNHSGNIHCHIVLNSLRKFDVETKDFMEREIDSKAGYKHHVTKKLTYYLKADLMDMCIRENLNQVDLLHCPKKRITEKEYYVKIRNEEKSRNPSSETADQNTKNSTSKTTPFETQKDYLRRAIEDSARYAKCEDEFASLLQSKYNVTLKISRGRYGYIHPDRKKPIRGRMLGTYYEEDSLRKIFDRNKTERVQSEFDSRSDNKVQSEPVSMSSNRHTETAHEKNHSPTDQISKGKESRNTSADHKANPYQSTKTGHSGSTVQTNTAPLRLPPILNIRSELRLVVDLQTCVKAQVNDAYARKVRLSNLKQMASAVAFAQENNIGSMDELNDGLDQALQNLRRSRAVLEHARNRLTDINERIHYMGEYLSTKSVYQKYLKAWNKHKFRNEHMAEIVKYEAARDWLKAKSSGGKLPTLDALKAQKSAMLNKMEVLQQNYLDAKEFYNDYKVMKGNIESIFADSAVPSFGQYVKKEQTTKTNTAINNPHPGR